MLLHSPLCHCPGWPPATGFGSATQQGRVCEGACVCVYVFVCVCENVCVLPTGLAGTPPTTRLCLVLESSSWVTIVRLGRPHCRVIKVRFAIWISDIYTHTHTRSVPGIQLIIFRYSPSFRDQLFRSDLIGLWLLDWIKS